MSWADPCSNCGQHRADCDCGDWNGYEAKRLKNKLELCPDCGDKHSYIPEVPSFCRRCSKDHYGD